MKRAILLLLFISCLSKLQAQTEGNAFFTMPIVHDVELQFHQSNYWDSLTAGYTTDVYIKGNITIDDSVMLDCGIKFKGNSSYNNPSNKKSWKLDFNEYVSGQKHDGLKKLNLNNCFKDPTFMREKLMLDFLNYRGLPAPRCAYARVYVNGTYWGLYTVVEEIDKTFLDHRFNDKKGNLFKGDPSGDLKYLGSSPTPYYTKYELKTNETQNDWTDLVLLLDKLNNTPINSLPDTLDHYFDLQSYYYTWAAHIIFSNLDSYAGSGHNYYVYHDSSINKFRFITWDVNEAFGNFNQGMSVTQIQTMSAFYVPSPSGNRPLHERLLQNTAAKQELVNAICDLVNYDFSIWNMEYTIDSIANAIRPDVYADPNKFFSNQNFEDNIENMISVSGTPGGSDIPGLKSFLVDRRNAIASELNSFGCTVGISESSEAGTFILFPQPANDYIYISKLPYGSWTYSIFNLSGQKVAEGKLDQRSSIDIQGLEKNGLYLIRLNDNFTQSSFIRKFLKL